MRTQVALSPPEYEALQRRVRRLERALRIYADPSNWDEDDWGVPRAFSGHYGRKNFNVDTDDAWTLAEKALRR